MISGPQPSIDTPSNVQSATISARTLIAAAIRKRTTQITARAYSVARTDTDGAVVPGHRIG